MNIVRCGDTDTSSRATARNDVVLNEVAPNDNEWIELLNPTGSRDDISGWFIRIDGTRLKAPNGVDDFVFNTTLQPMTHYRIEEGTDFAANSLPALGDFNISLQRIVDTNEETVDQTDLPSVQPGMSAARYCWGADSDSFQDWYVSTAPTG